MKPGVITALLLSVVLAHGYQNYHRSPYSGNCGVQMTRGKDGGLFYASTGNNHGSYGYGGNSDSSSNHHGVTAASNHHSHVASSSGSGNSGYYGSYAGGYGTPSGRYPGVTQFGNSHSNGNNGQQSSGSSYDRAQSSSYGSSSSNRNNYGSTNLQSAGSSSYDQISNNAGASNYGSGGSGWSQNAGASGSSSDWNAVRFARDVLSAHNSFRAQHNTPAVTLDDRMTRKAQQWADELAAGRVEYGHSPDAVEGIYGESIQVMNTAYPAGSEVIGHWYKEMDNYNYRRPEIVKRPLSQRNSHFTALVWYGTRQIGVGKATNSGTGKSYVVVTYYPPGNNVDVLEDNVFPVQGLKK